MQIADVDNKKKQRTDNRTTLVVDVEGLHLIYLVLDFNQIVFNQFQSKAIHRQWQTKMHKYCHAIVSCSIA